MATDAVRVGRDGFTGSPITDWCAPCGDWIVRRNDGGCPWCDHRPKTQEEARAAQREKRRLLNEQRDARILGYAARGFSNERIGRQVGLTRTAVARRRVQLEVTADACS